MYINPFAAGIVLGIVIGVIGMFCVAYVLSRKDKK